MIHNCLRYVYFGHYHCMYNESHLGHTCLEQLHINSSNSTSYSTIHWIIHCTITKLVCMYLFIGHPSLISIINITDMKECTNGLMLML